MAVAGAAVPVAGAVLAVAGRNMGSRLVPTSAALAGAISAVATSCAGLGVGLEPPHIELGSRLGLGLGLGLACARRS